MRWRERLLAAFVLVAFVALIVLAFLAQPDRHPDPGSKYRTPVVVPETVPAPDLDGRAQL